MGTKLEIENYLPAHYSMLDLSRESSGSGWPSCSNFPNGQLYHGLPPSRIAVADSQTGYDKDVVKQTILEHEAIFKDQVCELHRLYRVQRDLMDKVKRKEQFKRIIPYETSSSSSPLPFQMQSEDVCNGPSLLASPVSPFNLKLSPSSDKGKSVQTGPSPLQDSYSPKNSEVSESRPTKFRKGTLDLQLPAADNIHPFEKPENETMFPSNTGKVFQGDAAVTSGLHISKSKALADLNEPLLVDETITFPHVDFVGHAGSNRDLSASLNGYLDNYHALEPEQYKAGVKSVNQGLLLEKAPVSSQTVCILHDQTGQPPSFLTSVHIKAEPGVLKSVGITGKSDYSYPLYAHNIADPIRVFHASSRQGLANPPDYGDLWGKPKVLLQNPTSIQPGPFLSGVNPSKSPQSSGQSNGLYDNKWNLNGTSGEISAFGSQSPVRKGFCEGSPAAFIAARFPPPAFDYAKCDSNDFLNPVKEVNLNVAFPNGISNDYINLQLLKITEKGIKPELPLAVLPWLRGKGKSNVSSSGVVNTESKRSESSQKIFGVSIFGNPPMPKEESHSTVVNPLDIHHRSGYNEIESRKRKSLFDMNVPCELSDSEQEVSVSEKKPRNDFDLNSCITEDETPCGYKTSSVKVGAGIDLEALINLENEAVILPVKHFSRKEPETRPDNVTDDGLAELIKSAASAIVAMSSCVDSIQTSKTTCLPLEAEGGDPLHWFVSIACSNGNDTQDDKFPEALEDFEYMILRQKECTPDEYFPKPSIPDFSIIDHNTCVLTKPRARKGQARKGRKKRDFQRDILPSLAMLSRYEVTVDFQTFGGLSGFAKTRNGRGRGRPRSVKVTPVLVNAVCAVPLKQQEQVQGNNTKVGVGDKSLTGWGKTTRRPRRQRCPAGNHVLPVLLT